MPMSKEELKAHADRMTLHAHQIMAGLIPPDSPPGFTVPQPTDERGLPWWFGPDYKPTEEAMAAWRREHGIPDDEDDAAGD
jgi:hypothetical protein